MSDNVNNPSHYNNGDIECIDAIEAALGAEGFIDYCRGNVIKYTWRAMYKGNCPEDLAKAAWYANRASVCAAENEILSVDDDDEYLSDYMGPSECGDCEGNLHTYRGTCACPSPVDRLSALFNDEYGSKK